MLFIPDREPPTLTCPENIAHGTFGDSATVSWPPALASDNLGLRTFAPVLYSHASGSVFPSTLPDADARPVDITVRAYDTFNNEAVCQFQVTVLMLTGE